MAPSVRLLRRRTTVLVTGGCGFIGHHLVRHLLQSGHRVAVLDDLSTGLRGNLPSHPRLRFLLGSVLDPASVAAASGSADLVVHLAGIVGMRLATRCPGATYVTSTAGTRNVLRACKAPVVAVSSSAVYGLDADPDGDESHALPASRPLAYDGGMRGYASGKWMLERLASRASLDGRPTLIVRPFNVVGPGQRGTYGMVLPRFLDDALHDRPLLVYGDGTQTRSFCDVATFVHVLVRLICTPAAWKSPALAVNIGNPCSTSVLDLASVVLQVTGSGSPIRCIPYESVFPGKRDVLKRVPRIDRLEGLIGRIDWPALHAVVRRTCEAMLVDSVAPAARSAIPRIDAVAATRPLAPSSNLTP
jgi:UDP-glucose 4-epimerase